MGRLPTIFKISAKKSLDLRYGENPDQKASLYIYSSQSPFKKIKKLAGQDPSLVNFTDINAGIASVRVFKETAAVIIKHGTPCGIALGADLREALSRAIEADPKSAFGGIIVCNKKFDLSGAQVIADFKGEMRSNIDVVAAPEVTKEALNLIQKVRPNGRTGVFTFDKLASNPKIDVKSLDGALIVQTSQPPFESQFKDWKIVTNKKPSKKQLEQMKFAWMAISKIRSNSVIVVDESIPMTRGIGTGQTARVLSTEIALKQAGKLAKGGILASDSFFPFDDSVKIAAKAGIGAIVQQGGSVIGDKKCIEAADKAGISMIFTGHRAFWH